MRCERHRLAAGPDGRCALCERARQAAGRALARQGDRQIRYVLKVVLAVATFFAAFALLMEIFDTRGNPDDPSSSEERQRGTDARPDATPSDGRSR